MAPYFKSRLRKSLASRSPVVGAFCSTPSTYSAEVFADSGYDYVCIDTQHGLIGYESMVPMIQAMRFSETAPLVRVPSLEGGWAAKALDAGAEGVLFPMIESADDARAAVRLIKYAPVGDRSFGPTRAAMLLGRDPASVNAETLCIVMIESAAGVAAADDICAVDGVDAVYIGPADLGISLGVPAVEWFVSSIHDEAIETIRLACERAGIVAGIHCSNGRHGAEMAAKGFSMVTVAMDTTAIRTAATGELKAVREATNGV